MFLCWNTRVMLNWKDEVPRWMENLGFFYFHVQCVFDQLSNLLPFLQGSQSQVISRQTKWYFIVLGVICNIICCHRGQWRTQKIFMGGGLLQGHMVVICIWCALFVTSKFDVMSMFPNQRFGKVCWQNNAYFSTRTPLISCVIALNVNYQRSKLGYRRKINSTLWHSSS